jgi:hypothetical protein
MSRRKINLIQLYNNGTVYPVIPGIVTGIVAFLLFTAEHVTQSFG